MNIAAAFFLLLLSAPPARAGAGSEALPFLKLDAGARGAALSGAYCAAGDDALSVFYNPAGTALTAKKEILLAHNEWLEGLRNETMAYVHPIGPRLTAFGGFNALFSGSMNRYNSVGYKTGTFNAMEAAVSAGVSVGFGLDYFGGAAVKVLSQQAAGGKASAWAGDAGLLKAAGDWRIGVSASNFGGRLKFGSRGFELPLILRAGVSRNFLQNYMVTVESVKAGRAAAASALGAEARVHSGPKEYFFLRAGYKTGRSRNAGPGFTAGVGLTNRDLRVDYAFAPYGDLGDAHRVTVALRFGELRPEEVPEHPQLPPVRGYNRVKPTSLLEEPKKEKKKKKKKAAGDDYFMW